MEARSVFGLLVLMLGCGSEENPLRAEKEPSAALSVSAPPSIKLGETLPVVAELTNIGDKTIVLQDGGQEVA